jgi:hypothetical protein
LLLLKATLATDDYFDQDFNRLCEIPIKKSNGIVSPSTPADSPIGFYFTSTFFSFSNNAQQQLGCARLYLSFLVST